MSERSAVVLGTGLFIAVAIGIGLSVTISFTDDGRPIITSIVCGAAAGVSYALLFSLVVFRMCRWIRNPKKPI